MGRVGVSGAGETAMAQRGEGRRDLFPLIALAAVVLLMIGGVVLFPRIAGWLHYQDCIAAGYTPSSCGP